MGIAVFPAAASGPTLAEITSNLPSLSQISNNSNWTQIATTTTGGSSSISFQSIASGYKAFHLVLVNLRANTGNTDILRMRLNNDSGNNYGYNAIRSGSNSTGAFAFAYDMNSPISYIQLNVGNTATGNTAQSRITILGNETSNNIKFLKWNGVFAEMISSNSTNTYYEEDFNNATWTNTSEINRIDLLFTGGTETFNLTNGRVTLYGAK